MLHAEVDLLWREILRNDFNILNNDVDDLSGFFAAVHSGQSISPVVIDLGLIFELLAKRATHAY